MKKKYIAKKKFGQNFLKDDYVLNKIIQSMPQSNLKTVEIGPGLGDLTHKMVDKYKVEAFEIDKDLFLVLKKKFSKEIENGFLSINNVDVLDVWDENLIDEPYNLVANLPYYISTRIILNALMDNNCKSIVVMVQREVALKFEENISSSLSVIANLVSNTKILFDVSPESFDPVPKVTSSVIRFDKFTNFVDKDGIFENKKRLNEFLSFLKICFKAPRKTLFKNLSSDFDKNIIKNVFEDSDIEQNTRPHQLATSTYKQLFDALNAS
ncbi:MAG: SSU rRNA (adenine(1518)-N(6)/adenine(1519)-N(6))-dimethyltransferase (EC [uncultured Campylobacterales bacterium]|uniref:Ribosomal RNA small subunit methyltransferase A n=1 Tax=uncultured Campylobacterales bacterium TaxID=352960 RepID=A0A6S6SIC3_9BACT|nr:MAG: SSU rRNA (adenine(1518)-N(6)/adenine(1519)-N(6))-dimethyltransferase (EC [uncultured Campylobacterales bacterium]